MDRRVTGSLTVGVDIGGTNLRAAVVDADGQILDIEKLPTPSNVYALETALVHAIGCLQRRNEGIGAVGLAVAGFINSQRDTVRFAPHLPWRNAKVTERLSAKLGLPVELEHDANSAALGEYYLGAAQGAGTWVLFALGTGIGGAVMVDGEIYRGAFGTAPEFGHLTVMPGGRACPCGKQGCLERYCSGSALPLTAQDLIATGRFPDSAITREFAQHPEEISGRAVAPGQGRRPAGAGGHRRHGAVARARIVPGARRAGSRADRDRRGSELRRGLVPGPSGIHAELQHRRRRPPPGGAREDRAAGRRCRYDRRGIISAHTAGTWRGAG